MKKLLAIIGMLMVFSLSSFSQEHVPRSDWGNIDILPIIGVSVKAANMEPSWGIYLDYVNRRGSGIGTMFSYGEQYSIAGNVPYKYWSVSMGYAQDIFSNKFTLYIGGGVTEYKETVPLPDEYTVPIISTYLTWRTKAYGFDIITGTDIGFVDSNLHRTQPSNFPVKVIFGIGWDFEF